MFNSIKTKVKAQFDVMSKHQLFIVNLDRNTLWEAYLNCFTDPEEKQEHNCNCCKSFLRQYANIVAIIDNKIVTMWDFEVDGLFSEVPKVLGKLVREAPIQSEYLSDHAKLGTDFNITKEMVKWTHFYIELPKEKVHKGSLSIDSVIGETSSTKQVFKRSLDEITIDAIETVLELIEQNSLYRGTEFKPTVSNFLLHKKAYDKSNTKDLYAWSNFKSGGKIRNTAIGTLLVDLSEGMELDQAVRKFEAMVAPSNYKRPTALITKSMIDNAKKEIQELGLEDSLQRRYATEMDIPVDQVIFISRDSIKEKDVFDTLADSTVVNPKKLTKVEEITLEDFISKVVPTAKNIELLLEGKQSGNFMSLTAPIHPEAPLLFPWNNGIAFSYSGNVADSMKERVDAAGGRTDGVLRFTHEWNHDGQNQSLMDLHVFLPNSGYKHVEGKEVHDKYPNNNRVGWNHRQHLTTKGIQDVDYTSPPGADFIPIENITFPELKALPEGVYWFKIHNWNARNPNKSGFKAEIAIQGQVYFYEYSEAVGNKEWITVAKATLKNGNFTIEHLLPESNKNSTSKNIWNIGTNKLHKVKMITRSPNFLTEDYAKGNKHTFFILEDCLNPEAPRGFFNEFLKPELQKHRKVFEVLGNKLRVSNSDIQLSGLGFSSTQPVEFFVKVTGSFSRYLKVKV